MAVTHGEVRVLSLAQPRPWVDGASAPNCDQANVATVIPDHSAASPSGKVHAGGLDDVAAGSPPGTRRAPATQNRSARHFGGAASSRRSATAVHPLHHQLDIITAASEGSSAQVSAAQSAAAATLERLREQKRAVQVDGGGANCAGLPRAQAPFRVLRSRSTDIIVGCGPALTRSG